MDRRSRQHGFYSLSARATLKAQYEKLHKAVLAIVREDVVCRRLMTVPGVGPLVAVTFKSAVDDPSRIAKSKAVGALFGLTPKKYQSGEKDVTGGITRTGDEMVRTALYEAANVLLSRITRFSKCSVAWGCALPSVGRPWVAQRVWPMPIVPVSGSRTSLASRLRSLPSARRRKLSAFQRGNASGVVAPIFEPLERVDKQARDRLTPENAYNSAHASG
jgi:Transposase IS116/IS110/IS902 family